MRHFPKEIYSSAARTATPASVEIKTPIFNGIHLITDVTATAATPSITPKIEAYDSVSGKWYELVSGAAITATGTSVLKLGDDLEAVSNTVANDYLPGKIRITMTHADADSITYSVGANLFEGAVI